MQTWTGQGSLSKVAIGSLDFLHMCLGRSAPYIGDKLIPPLVRNRYNGYINRYYWVDDHPLASHQHLSTKTGNKLLPYDVYINTFINIIYIIYLSNIYIYIIYYIYNV